MFLASVAQMAKLMSSLFLVLLLVLSMTAFLAQAAPVEQVGSEKIIQLTYYAIGIRYGPNATTVPVAGIDGKLWASNTFGTIFVNDLPLTEGPCAYSPKVGRVRGLSVVSKDESANYISSSVTFTNREYNGSTLQRQGTIFNSSSRQPSVLSIVGGTGKFEGARGYAFLQPYNNSIVRNIFKFTVF